ncbi:sulfotransferase domain-containing protein [Egicoccus halophilus]|uniref:Sulfotransferase n=1 Tax=Egicoccus halophilus TaxID=1670830 RepID=A0A8J3A9Z7_9ACTN|nr:sulfotransferase domain-containing protein [Egicoccus halophilus]GGI05987.1 sulfotransferase [Egicoccus halophilus]
MPRTPALAGLRSRVADWRWHRSVDTYLVSYPKSGRTWLRLMLGELLRVDHGVDTDDPTDLYGITAPRSDLPTLAVRHEGRPHRSRREEIRSDKRRFRSKDVILLVRDPRDVVVSSYFQASRRDARFTGTLEEFIAAPVGGFDTILRFYGTWAAARSVPRRFLLVRYEDLHRDTRGELARVVDFLGLRASPEGLDHAVAAGDFDRMRELESSGAIAAKRMRPGDASDAESYKMRRGEVGGAADYLDAEQFAQLTERVRRELPPMFGYPVALDGTTRPGTDPDGGS